MKLYRYELYCEDEPQDVGFLVGVEDLGLSCEKEEALLYPFDSLLQIPKSPYMRDSVSFFTEEGHTRFQPDIFRVAAAYEDSIFDIKLCTIDLPEDYLDAVIYQDENQVCLPRNLYRESLDPLVSRVPFHAEEHSKGPFKVRNPMLIGDLYHVGTMDLSKKSRFSLEGNGLSVSNCPDAWCAITEGFTHGDYFKLSKPDLQLLDYYALTSEEVEEIQNWAIQHGYVLRGSLYKSISWNEEGSECYSLFQSFDEALMEADEDEERVIMVPGLLPTQKLLDQSLVQVELLHIPYIITELYTEQVLNYDGIYWDEVLDISSYSAPRGVIFNSKLPLFDVVNTSQEEKQPLTEQLDRICSCSAEQNFVSQSQKKKLASVREFHD